MSRTVPTGGEGGSMIVGFGREKAYVLSLALVLVALIAFGVVVVRDYGDSGSRRGEVARLAVAGSDPAVAALPESAAPAAGQAVGAPSGGAAGPAPVRAGGTGAITQPERSDPRIAGGGAVVPRIPGGSSPACVDGHIRIGQIDAITGPLTMQTAANATAAYFKKVNSEGGINGCQVDFTYLDDGGLDQQKGAADARELVQADNVFAVVGGFAPITSETTEPYFRRAGVPVVGVDGVGLAEYNSPVEYSFAISPQGFGIATADMAHRLGKKRLAVFYVDIDVTIVSFEELKKQAAINGQEIVYSNAENIASATYGTDVVAARNANPDVVVNILDANSAVREINAMSSNNWYPDLVGTTSSADPVVIQQGAPWLSNPNHQVHVLRCYLPANANTPEVREWLETQGKYFPGFDPNAYAEGSWMAAKIFTDIARRLGPGLTRTSLMAALNSLRDYHTGFTPDITMTPDHGPNKQALWMRWDGSQFTQVLPFAPW
jgi:branched-chain amino acid transport system substrate-binding protein